MKEALAQEHGDETSATGAGECRNNTTHSEKYVAWANRCSADVDEPGTYAAKGPVVP
jgi:hypothetical protein